MGFIKDLFIEKINNIFLLLYILLLIIFFYIFYSKNTNQLSSYIFVIYYFIIFGVVISGLSIIYFFFKNKIENIKGILFYIKNFVFYIPKLINEIIEFLIQQYHLTPNRLIWLFFIEIIFILLYFLFSYFIEKKINQKGKYLLKEPIFLSEKKTIANNNDLFPIFLDKENENKIQRRNYAFSLWIYLNQQNGTNDKNIFSYGSHLNVKPKISYLKKSKEDSHIIRIYFTFINDENDNENIKPYFDFELPRQKWNNIIVNYNNNTVDLFLNGQLIKTFIYSDKFPLYENSDLVEIGNEGLNGAICNIVYYKNPLTNFEIVNLYNLLYQKNPPSL